MPIVNAGDAPADAGVIVAIGEPMVEFNQTMARMAEYRQGFGGDTSNFIIAAARQGAKTAYLTRIGDDEFGCMLLGLWDREQVDASRVTVDSGAHTAVYFVTHGEQGHSFSYMRSGSAASRMQPSDLDPASLRDARFLHASGISQAISASACDTVFAAIDAARGAGASIIYDPNLRTRLWPLARARAIIRATAGMSDYFLPSLEDAQLFSGRDSPDAIIDWCLDAGATHILLKLGRDGVLVCDGTRREHVPGIAVDVIDATGAGDCFAGALAARLTAGDTLMDAARYANAAAALTTTGFGAVAPIPHAEQVLSLLGVLDVNRRA
jgi:2-dehydro-3-deoxygluconokinase